MSESSIVTLSIFGMLLLAICFIVYFGIRSDIKQKEIIKEVIQEVIKQQQVKDSTNDEK